MGTWYLANGFGIALGGLLGFGIGNIKGSLPSWKFEFLIIGALCFVWGIVMYIFLPDSPVTAKGLTLREKRVVVERLRGNQTGIENKHLKAYQVKEAFCDVKLYLFFLLGMVCNIPNGGEYLCPLPLCSSYLTHTLLPPTLQLAPKHFALDR
jgi:MFS family permease